MRRTPVPPRDLLTLPSLAAAEPAALLGLRILVGSFLIWGVWDNIISIERMAEFSRFLGSHRFSFPDLFAPLSIWAQFLCGIALVLGLGVRWAGLVCGANFIVAIIWVDGASGIRAAFPAAALLAIGLYLAARGAGPLSLDRLLAQHRDPELDLAGMAREDLLSEVRRLRAGVRRHRDATGHELCWHHPELWALLPEKTEPDIAVPAWPQFIRGCVAYRQSLEVQSPDAPRSKREFEP